MNFQWVYLTPFFSSLFFASLGAYKDVMIEGFKTSSFVREFVFGLIGFIILSYSAIIYSQPLIVIFWMLIAIIRSMTEGYKWFIRTEDQSLYKIPSTVHIMGHATHHKGIRLLVLMFCLGLLGGLAWLGHSSSNILYKFPTWFSGAIIGLIVGLLCACGGGYKDGFFEGFDGIKFWRSPLVSMVCGMIIYPLTHANVIVTMIAVLGLERMVSELWKTFHKPCYCDKVENCYCPGKFKDELCKNPPYQVEWCSKRNLFLISLILSLLFMGILLYKALKIN